MSSDMPGTRRLSYKYRIYPTAAQKEAIQANLDACRFIYNRLLRLRIDSYQATKPTLKVHALAPGADPESERPEWLRDEDGPRLSNLFLGLRCSLVGWRTGWFVLVANRDIGSLTCRNG